MTRITIHIDVPDTHPWTKQDTALVVGTDTDEVTVTNRTNPSTYTVVAWNTNPPVDTHVAYYDGDTEYDGTNGDEFDAPGWVAFAKLDDGTLVWPAGHGSPRATQAEAEALADWIRMSDHGPVIDAALFNAAAGT